MTTGGARPPQHDFTVWYAHPCPDALAGRLLVSTHTVGVFGSTTAPHSFAGDHGGVVVTSPVEPARPGRRTRRENHLRPSSDIRSVIGTATVRSSLGTILSTHRPLASVKVCRHI